MENIEIHWEYVEYFLGGIYSKSESAKKIDAVLDTAVLRKP